MRIFQVIEATSNSALAKNQTWYRNLYEPLLDLGHEVILFPANEGRLAKLRKDQKLKERFSQKLVDIFKENHSQKPFDLFFAYLMDDMINPAAIDEIRKHNVLTCNFSCNNAHQFDLVDELSPHFDYCLHSERDAFSKFLSVGATPIWFQMAANPKYYYPRQIPRNKEVSFVGMNYSKRAYYISHLLNNGIDVQVYGPGWVLSKNKQRLKRWIKRNFFLIWALISSSPELQTQYSATAAQIDAFRLLSRRYPRSFHNPIQDEAMISLFSESQISLGFLEVHKGHDPSAPVTQHLHLREFEAPMSGALYCTGYCDEITEFYEPNQEVIVYRNQHELLDKIRFYLKHEESGERIRQAGRKRALECHTYQKRFHDLFIQLCLYS